MCGRGAPARRSPTVDAIPDRTFSGRLAQIRNPYTPSEKQNAQAAPQSTITNFDGVIEVDNADLLLRPSLTANVSIVVSKSENTLRIPNGALRVQIPQDPGSPHPPPPPPDSVDTSVVYRLAGRKPERGAGARAREARDHGQHQYPGAGGLKEGDAVITGIPPRIEVPQRRGLF